MNRSTNRGLLVAQLAIVALVFAVVALVPGEWTALRVIGVVLMVTGAILLFVARVQLGDSFSLTAQAHHLVTHGIYSRIRNPIYVFGGLFFLGFALAGRFPALLFIFLILIPMQVIRARNEAKVLEEKFGDEYRRYRAQTWF